ncbi:MAG TPA: F0F1 ATP synthase subunit B [Gemmatimonadales bacterium]|nr:F0F1 ATP synthase subunit B [Gemmatimonadales bacterium]
MRRLGWLAAACSVFGAVPLAAQEAAANPNPLTVDGGLMLWTLFVFGLLLFLLKRTAWPVLLQAVRDRETRLEQQIAEAEKARTEARELLEQHRALLAGGKHEAQQIIAAAKAAGEKDREALLGKARQEYDAMLARARQEITVERDRARQSLRREAVDLSIAAASKLVETQLDSDTNRKLVSAYLDTLAER